MIRIYNVVCKKELIGFCNKGIINVLSIDSYLSCCNNSKEVDQDSLKVVGLYKYLSNFVIEYKDIRRNTKLVNFGIRYFYENNYTKYSKLEKKI